MRHFEEILFHFRQKTCFRPALEDFGNKNAALGQNVFGKIIGQFNQSHGAQVIGLLVAVCRQRRRR